jgi:hypothetical protein
MHTRLYVFSGAVKEAQCSPHVDIPGTRLCVCGCTGYAIAPPNTGCWCGRAPPHSRPPGNHGDGKEAGATVEGLRALVSERVRASASKSYWAPPFPPPPRRSSRAPSLDPAPQLGGCSPLGIPAPPTQRTQLPPARVQNSAEDSKLPLHIQSAVSARSSTALFPEQKEKSLSFGGLWRGTNTVA